MTHAICESLDVEVERLQARPPVSSNESTAARLTHEGLISLREAAPIFGTGRGGKARHPATLTRDILKGASLPDGGRVRLEAVRINGAFKTSRQAVLRYIERQQFNPESNGEELPTPARARRAQASASAELDALLNK